MINECCGGEHEDLRPLTPAEQQTFPGLQRAIRVMKGQLTNTLTTVPQSRAGWVVWLAELYPDCFLMRLPGGASILVTDGNTAWTLVADTVPVTTIARAAALVQRQRWQAGVLSSLRQSLLLDNVP